MLFIHYGQNKTTTFIQNVLDHSLSWHYCIHLPEYQHPLLDRPAVILISLDTLQLLAIGTLLSQFQFLPHLPHPFILICLLQPPPCPPIPISQSSSQFSSHNFSLCLLNHQTLFSTFAQLYFDPAADLVFIFYWDIFPNSSSSCLKVFHQSQDLIFPIGSTCWDKSQVWTGRWHKRYTRDISQLWLWTWHNRSHSKLKIREIFLSPKGDHAGGILVAKT